MPQCKFCGRMDATAEMRRSPKGDGTWTCKNKVACHDRRRRRPADAEAAGDPKAIGEIRRRRAILNVQADLP